MTAILPPHDAFLSWLVAHMGDDLPSTLQRMDMRQAFDAGRATERERIRAELIDIVIGHADDGNKLLDALLEAIRELCGVETLADVLAEVKP